MRSREERRWLFEDPTQCRISPSILKYTKTNRLHWLKMRGDSSHGAVLSPGFLPIQGLWFPKVGSFWHSNHWLSETVAPVSPKINSEVTWSQDLRSEKWNSFREAHTQYWQEVYTPICSHCPDKSVKTAQWRNCCCAAHGFRVYEYLPSRGVFDERISFVCTSIIYSRLGSNLIY